ncbi:hypothetical protein BT96DRAFT_1027660, partial [Gymnopus androsaceus JB14]
MSGSKLLLSYLFIALVSFSSSSMPGLRNNKEFRAYAMSPGEPIQGPIDFNLNMALNKRASDSSPSPGVPSYSSNSPAAAGPDCDSDDGFDLESEASDSESISFDPVDPDGFEPDPTSLSSSFSIPAFLRRLFSRPPSEPDEVQSESEDRPSGAEDEPLTGLAARRKRKKERKRDKRNVKRKLTQDELGTTLKEISRKKAARSHTISTDESFSSEALPVNSGGWSGLRQKLEKINPTVQELLDKHDMQIVDWDGRQSYAVVDNEGRIITALAGTPDDPNWIPLMQELAENVRHARDHMSFSTSRRRTSAFPALLVSIGNSFGGGSKRPGTM